MGMTISILRLYFRRSVLSYQRRFPVVYLIWWAMRRPRLVNKQLEVYAFFCVYKHAKKNENNNNNTKKPMGQWDITGKENHEKNFTIATEYSYNAISSNEYSSTRNL